MKRAIMSSFMVAVLLLVICSSNLADVDISLNIVPNDYSDPTQGGNWSLVAKTDTVNSAGIVGLLASFELGTIPAVGTVNPNIGGFLFVGTFLIPIERVEFVYGQPGTPWLLGVGLPGGPSDIGPDPLGDPVWDSASEIAFGAIPDLTTIPVPVPLFAGANEVEEVGGISFAATIDQFVVRVAMLVLGDANGDGVLDNLDISAFGLALFNPTAYAAAYPGVDTDVVLDMNNDGVFNNFDIAGFGAALGF